MLTDDECDPRTKRMKPRALDALSVDDLRHYITDMQMEIQRVEAEITRKEKTRSAADSFFNLPPQT